MLKLGIERRRVESEAIVLRVQQQSLRYEARTTRKMGPRPGPVKSLRCRVEKQYEKVPVYAQH